jgi:serine phosphatase RsbU (regulator of sigma subunit)/anti-sigma regulatory factor (Ser/Thr protein kinase)
MDSAGITQADHRCALRIETVCDLSAVRGATLKIRGWLAETGLDEEELGAWELALVEAVNNAVKYCSPEGRQHPVTIEISAGNNDIEARITDHTAGFDWPTEVKAPAFESESGRGLFLMESLTDSVTYLRHAEGNILIMRRARPAGGPGTVPDATRLQARLSEAEASLTEMTAELATNYESLVAVFRYSAELGAQTDLKDFTHRLLRDLMQIVEADGAMLRLLSADGKKLETLLLSPENQKLPPREVTLGEPEAWAEIRAAKKRQDIWFDTREPLAKDDPLRVVMPVGNGICHPFMVGEQLVGTATLGRLAADRPFTAAQINLLHTFTDFLAIQIVNSRLLNERTAAHVTRRELQIAADIQRSLLPAKIPACPPFVLSAACQSALEIGGDFYDLIPAGENAALLVIADVMGKGVPAALFAAVLRSTIRSMPQLFSKPGELLEAANRTLFADLSGVDMFITAQVAYLNGPAQEMISATAGHCPLLVWKPGETEALPAGGAGLPLGIEERTVYSQVSTPLPPGSAALLYTDGLTEARNAAREMLGEKRLRSLFVEAAANPGAIEMAKQFILQQINQYSGQAPLTDDQTLIVIRHLK